MKKVGSKQKAVGSGQWAAGSRHLLLTAYCILLTISLILSASMSKESAAAEKIRVAILPWKINAAENLGYLKGAVYDMLISRIGAEPAIEIVKESSLQS